MSEEEHSHSFEKKELNSPLDDKPSASGDEDNGEEVSDDKNKIDEPDKKEDEKNDSDKKIDADEEGSSDEKVKTEEKNDEGKPEEIEEESRIKDKEEIDAELREIYEDKDGKVPDMSNFKTKKSNSMYRAFTIFLFSLLFLAGVAWLGFFFFQPQDRFSEENVVLSVETKKQAGIGENIHYRIKYQNRQNVPLSKANINVRYPEGFVFDRAKPKPTEGDNTWNLGTIQEVSADYIDIYGKIYGDIGQKQTLRAFLNYTPANFSSPFQKVATNDVKLSESSIEASVKGPNKLSVGEKGSWDIDVNNNSPEPVENLRLRVKLSDSFRFTSKEPKSTNTPKNIWKIDKITDKKQFSFSGVYEEEHKDNEITIEILGQKDKVENKIDPERYLFAKSSYKVALSKTGVGFNLAINGALDNFSVRPGGALNTTLEVENKGKEPIKESQVKLVFDAPSNDRQPILERSILHWGEIKNVGTENIVGDQINEDIRRGTITWNSDSTSELSTIEPGDSVDFSFTLPVKDSEVIDLTEFDKHTIEAQADLKYKIDGKIETVTTNKFNITINSDLSINVKDTVTENDEGEKVHNVSWVLNNNFHKVEDIRVETDVFGDIEWMDDALNVTTGTAKFDEESQHLTWDIDSLPQKSKTQTLNFAVVLEEDDPTQTNLTSRVNVKATDAATGEEIVISGDEILLNTATSTQENP
ncbi:MAG: hypothetical protein ABEJ24_05440 [Candidatus Magasanikbacteria bacterium]